MARMLVIANQKGGVAKTTTALNLGLLLSRQHRVLLVDLDPQASLTSFLGIDPYRVERSSYSLLLFEEMTLARILQSLGSNLAVLPGSVDLATASIKIVQERLPLDRLRAALRQNPFVFDYVLIDTPPGLNVLTVVGLLAAEEVLIPAQCNQLAVGGIRAMQDVIRRIRDHMGNPGLKLRGILPTFFDAQAVYSQKMLDELRALLGEHMLRTVIPYDVHIADAPHQGKAVVEYAPDSPGALAYHRLAEELQALKASDQ